MKLRPYITVFSLTLMLVSCGNDNKKTTAEPEVVTVDNTSKKEYQPAESGVTFKDSKVGAAYENYILLKTALVNTDAATTARHATNLMTDFANIGMENDALAATQTIYESTDVAVQREAFVAVTAAMEKLLEGAIESGVIYKQYCPMAFDFKGAFWLSNSKDIYNPYFGDEMLRCGKVDSEIK
ncbi:MAG: DUF3347 domain-containing protein [Bacteroidota bacterium]